MIKFIKSIPLSCLFLSCALHAHPYKEYLSLDALHQNLDQLYDENQISYQQYLLNKAYAKQNEDMVTVQYLSKTRHPDSLHSNEEDYAVTFDILMMDKDINLPTHFGFKKTNIPLHIKQLVLSNKLLDPSIESTFYSIDSDEIHQQLISADCRDRICTDNKNQPVTFSSFSIQKIPEAQFDQPPYILNGGYHIKLQLLPGSHFKSMHLQDAKVQQDTLSLYALLRGEQVPFISLSSHSQSTCQANRAKALSYGHMSIQDYYDSLINHLEPILNAQHDMDGLQPCQDQMIPPYIFYGPNSTKRRIKILQDTFSMHRELWDSYKQRPWSMDHLFSQRFLIMYTQVYGHKVIYPRGEFLFKKAAEQGHADAQYATGYIFYNGNGVRQNMSTAALWFEKAAEQDHAGAQYQIAYMYMHGHGVTKNLSTAVLWFEKAAEQGHKYAQYYLGFLYKRGIGVTQSDSIAALWYEKAAEQGHQDAQYQLGFMYERGLGVTQNDETAAYWFNKAKE